MNRTLFSVLTSTLMVVAIALLLPTPQVRAFTTTPSLSRENPVENPIDTSESQIDTYAFIPGDVGIPERRQGGGTR